MAPLSLPGSVQMKILCAWCCGEGLPGYMGERAPILGSLRQPDRFTTSLPIGMPAR